MHVVIVIPTYNEYDSTPTLLKQLEFLCSKNFDHHISVVYVDGQSTDGTLALLTQAEERFSWLHVEVQEQLVGLGAAYAQGMLFAIHQLSADYIIEFDGDLQHKVENIPRFLPCIDEGYDYVIGSRFIEGGSIPKEWGIHRRMLSQFGNLVARTLLGLPDIRDFTSGFKLSRVKGFLDKFDFSSLLSLRHAYKIHLLWFMIQSGARTKEIPIVFEPRSSGESKLIKNDIIDTLRVVIQLKLMTKQGKK